MKIVVCHNYYQQPGGEDQVFAEEVELLRGRGHDVVTFTLHNDEIKKRGGPMGLVALVGDTVWNRGVHGQIRSLVQREKPQVVHFHNTFPLMSPASYYAAREGGAAVVQTLHNYRLMCPNGLFLRDGKVCEDCLGRTPWPAVVHKCYRDARGASAVAATMLTVHRAMGTYRDAIDVYVALTEFSRAKNVEGPVPAHKCVVKPNFINIDRGAGDGAGGYALFVGRLDPGKGLEVLLDAWGRIKGERRLKIIGDGALAPLARAAADADPRIDYVGRRPLEEVYLAMGEAGFLVVPSTWYEGFPRIIVEAYCKGAPVLASRLGALEEVVVDGETGLHFSPNDAADLAETINLAFSSPENLARMRRAARDRFESRYTADENYRQILAIYQRAIDSRGTSRSATNPAPSAASAGPTFSQASTAASGHGPASLGHVSVPAAGTADSSRRTAPSPV